MEEKQKENESELKQQITQGYLELQLIDRQLRQLQAQMQALEAQALELDTVSSQLDDFGRLEIGSELFVQIAPGIFAKAELKENKELLVNVGGGAAVKESIPETKALLAAQVAEIRKVQQELGQQIEKLTTEARKLEESIQKLISKK
ncbi:MAG: prefoldin subunit alpha [Candidatus Woesearchaeota archaeon]